MTFQDRTTAGQMLAALLERFQGPQTVVVALPRGGVEVGAEVARRLHVPLGLIIVRKIGHPIYPEYAIGAIAEGQAPIYNPGELTFTPPDWRRRTESAARKLMKERHDIYYGGDFSPIVLTDKTVIVVDDGIATGLTVQAALQAVRQWRPRRVILAAPVMSEESVELLKSAVDMVITLADPRTFAGSVGAHYRHFNQVNDEEVRALLREVRNDLRQTTAAGPRTAGASPKNSVSH